MRYGVWAGLTLGAFLIVANVSYTYLAATFGYDDILREPTQVILQRYAAGGSELVVAWTAFAWSALLFVLAACLVARALAKEHRQAVWMATAAGAASGIVQAAGLLRWVFVVPPLAGAYVGAPKYQQQAIVETFSALHQYGGVALGEHLGQVLLIAWTTGVARACWRAGGTLKLASFLGLLSIPLWIIGQTELFATAIPQLPVVEAAPIAFIVWMLWILALAGALMFPPINRRST